MAGSHGDVISVLRAAGGWLAGYPMLRLRLLRQGAPIWGTSRLAWVGGNLSIFVLTAFCLAVTYEFWTFWTFVGPLAAGLAASWTHVIRPWVGVDGPRLVVVGMLTARVVPLRDVMWVESSSTGLEIVCRDASLINVWAVQQSNLATAYAWNTRSSRVAAEIQRLADVARTKDES